MLRAAVVGAGVMGAQHARVLSQMHDATLVAVVDPDAERARVLAAAHGARPAATPAEVLDDVDVVVVATPTDTHVEAALEVIGAGVAVLVEKPLAPTSEQARLLLAAAERSGSLLAVGHVERFNPAVLELDRLVVAPLHVTAQRVGPYSGRIRDGVVIDLMIHDLDLVASLVRSDLARVQAVTQTRRSDTEDLASALLTFANGTTASLTASRIGQNKVRTVEITQPDDVVHVDLLRQDVTVHRVEHGEFLSSAGAAYRQSGVVEIPFLEHRGEPLFLELRHVLDCVRDGMTPRVGGLDGVRAVEMAEAVLAAAQPGAREV